MFIHLLGLDLGINIAARVDINVVVGLGLVVPASAFGPVVSNGIGKKLARLVKVHCCDGAGAVLERLEAGLGLLVPEVVRAVPSCCGKGSIDGMEC